MTYDYKWRKLAKEVLARDHYACWACGCRAVSADHIVPVSEAPHLRLVASNVRASCPKHNEGRTAGRMATMARINRSTAQVRSW